MALKLELERVRERGYSIDEEESVLEGRCFGVPIFGPAREVFAALSLSLPKMRVRDKQTEDRLVSALLRTTELIGSSLSGSGAAR